MDSAAYLPQKPHTHTTMERGVLKAFLLSYIHTLFGELFQARIKQESHNSSMGCYAMDSKIIQLLIRGIVETGEYTLEGIARYTQIPLDIILDAACGRASEFSITPWVRIVDIYTQVKPEITQLIVDRLLTIKGGNRSGISLLLRE